MSDRPKGDRFAAEHMQAEGHMLVSDKRVSKSMLWILLGVALTLLLGGVGFAVGGLWPVAAIWLPLSVLFMFMALLFPIVRTIVTTEEVNAKYGLWGPRIAHRDIKSCKAVPYEPMTYGGYGIRLSKGGVWAYVPTGCKEVVELIYDDAGKEKKVLIGAQDARHVADAINRARDVQGIRIADAQDETDAVAEAEAEAEAEQIEATQKKKR